MVNVALTNASQDKHWYKLEMVKELVLSAHLVKIQPLTSKDAQHNKYSHNSHRQFKFAQFTQEDNWMVFVNQIAALN